MKPFQRTILWFCSPFLLLSFGGCATDFDFAVVEGTWNVEAIRVASDDCNLAEALQSSLTEYVYTMGSAIDNSDAPQDLSTLSELVITRAQNNLWEVCDTDEGPLFNCDFPLPAIHFSQWASTASFPTATGCEQELSLSAIEGYSTGLFLTETTAFVDFWIELKCGEITQCSSSFGMDLSRQ